MQETKIQARDLPLKINLTGNLSCSANTQPKTNHAETEKSSSKVRAWNEISPARVPMAEKKTGCARQKIGSQIKKSRTHMKPSAATPNKDVKPKSGTN
jgi:hypothetical protein